MLAMRFDEADLAANRAGKLSAAQQNRLRQMQQRTLLIGGVLFFFFTLIATTLLFAGANNAAPILSLIGALVVVCNAISIGMFGRQWMRLAADLRRGTVVAVQGPLERVIRPMGRTANYVLRIEKIHFPVSKDVFKNFRHEQGYILYSAPYAHVLLSAEPLNPQNP